MSVTHEKIEKDINRGASITFIGNLLKLIEFPLTLLCARLFGVDTWGQYTFLATFIMPILRFSTLGLDKGLVWFIAKHQGFRIAPEFFFRIQKILIALCLILVAGYGLQHWLQGGGGHTAKLFEPVAFTLFVACIPFLVLTNMNLGISLGIKKPEHEALIRGIVYPLCYLAMPCLFSHFFHGIRALAFFYLVGSFAGYCVSFFLVRPVRAVLAAHPEGPEAREAFSVLFAYSWPLGLRDVMLSLQQRADVWCLALFLEPKYIGIYGLASSLAASVKTIRQSFDNIMLAVISQLKRTVDTDRIVEAYLYAAKMIMAVQAPVLAFLVFFARPILALSGKDYVLGEQAVIVFAFTLVLNGYLGLSAIIVMGLNKTKWALMNDMGALAWAVLFNFLLVPRYGVTGAALATSLSIFLTNLAWFGEAIYLLKRVPIRASVVVLFLASLLTLGASYLLWKSFGGDTVVSRGIGFALFIATYGAVVLVYLRKGILKIRRV
jgi:O-antigen/teichoic acid export membrane protein